jgi:hypothetical protein
VEDLHTSPSLWTTLWTNVANGSVTYHVLLSRQPHSPNNSKWGIMKGWVAVHHYCKNVSCTQLWNKQSPSTIHRCFSTSGCVWNIIVHTQIHLRYSTSHHMINPLTTELNPSTAWRDFLLGILLLEPCISLIHAWKTNKFNNYSFSLLIMYGSSYVFRHYIAIFKERSKCLPRVAQFRSSRQNIVFGHVVFSDVRMCTMSLNTTRPATIFYWLLLN